jgi:hypothetical protein
MDTPIIVPPASTLTAEEREEITHPENAKYNVFIDGQLLPVCRMMGMEGQVVTNPLHAFGCVAWDGQAWMGVSCKPGDITPKFKDRPWLKSSSR